MRYALKSGTKLTRYDGVVYQKFHTFNSITADNAIPNNGSMFISWGASGVSGVGELFIDDQVEFANTIILYRQWRVNGVKIEVYPRVDSTEGTSGIFNVDIGSSTTANFSASTTDSLFVYASDFKSYPARNQIIKRFYRLRKFFKQTAEEWLDAGLYYDNAGTLIRTRQIGYASGATVGRVHVTWYCMFRNRHG